MQCVAVQHGGSQHSDSPWNLIALHFHFTLRASLRETPAWKISIYSQFCRQLVKHRAPFVTIHCLQTFLPPPPFSGKGSGAKSGGISRCVKWTGPRNFRKLLERFARDVIARRRNATRGNGGNDDATRRVGIVLNSFTRRAGAASSRSRSFTGHPACSQYNVLLESDIWIYMIIYELYYMYIYSIHSIIYL